MPTAKVFLPEGFFRSIDEESNFVETVARSTATQMAARRPNKDGSNGEHVTFDPMTQIDVLLFPYRQSSHATAVVLVEIISYNWPDRLKNINARIGTIAGDLCQIIPPNRVPEGVDTVSVTFLPKPEGCWVAR